MAAGRLYAKHCPFEKLKVDKAGFYGFDNAIAINDATRFRLTSKWATYLSSGLHICIDGAACAGVDCNEC